MSEQKTISKKLKSLIVELNSKNEEEQLKAIKGLKVNGEVEAIEPMVRQMAISESEPVKLAIMEVLCSLKVSGAPEVIASCLRNEAYSEVHLALLNSIWNSGLDYKNHLKDIVNVALDGDMLEALECITILENTNGPFAEEEVLDPLLSCQQYLSNTTDESHKNELIKEIAEFLAKIYDRL